MQVNDSSEIVLSEPGKLSYPIELEKILDGLRGQGFRDFKVELATCYERSKTIDCYGKRGWRITYPAKEPYREPWKTWWFPEGIEDKSESVAVEVTVLDPIIESAPTEPTKTVTVDADYLELKQVNLLPEAD